VYLFCTFLLVIFVLESKSVLDAFCTSGLILPREKYVKVALCRVFQLHTGTRQQHTPVFLQFQQLQQSFDYTFARIASALSTCT
jgi:hypothetical protein